MRNQMKNKTEKTNPLIWFIFAIIIPIIVAGTLAIIIFSIAGFDTLGFMKSIGNKTPVISSIISSDEDKTKKKEELNTEGIIDKENENEMIQQLQEENEKLQARVKELEKENLKIEKTQESLENKEDKKEPENTEVQQFVGSFKDMEPNQAAQIIKNMNENTAISILKEMPNKVRGGILEAMDAKTAASLTQKLLHEN